MSDFDGRTYDAAHDEKRLTTQLKGVLEELRAGGWRTLAQLAAAVGGSEAGVSARLRDLRKQKFGSHDIEGRRVAGGLWEYRLRRSDVARPALPARDTPSHRAEEGVFPKPTINMVEAWTKPAPKYVTCPKCKGLRHEGTGPHGRCRRGPGGAMVNCIGEVVP